MVQSMSYSRYALKLFPGYRQRNHCLHCGTRRKQKRAKARKDRAYAIFRKYNPPACVAVFKKDGANLHRVIRSARFSYDRRLALELAKLPKFVFPYFRRKREP